MHIVAQSTDTGHCISSVNIRVATGSDEQVDRFAASFFESTYRLI